MLALDKAREKVFYFRGRKISAADDALMARTFAAERNDFPAPCAHCSNPIDNRARTASPARVSAAQDIATRYPSLCQARPDIAAGLAAWDAQVDAHGIGSVQAPGIAVAQ